MLLGLNYEDAAILNEAENLIAGILNHSSPFIVVSNETGWGIVPVNPLARRFRDLSGAVNSSFAAAAVQVKLMVSGIPVKVK